MILLVRCYAAAVPFLVWAVLLTVHAVDDDTTRVPFLLMEFVAVCVSVNGLRARYRDLP